MTILDNPGNRLPEVFVNEPPTVSMTSSLTGNEEQALPAALESRKASEATSNPLAFDTATGTFLVFAGGRGDGSEDERRR